MHKATLLIHSANFKGLSQLWPVVCQYFNSAYFSIC